MNVKKACYEECLAEYSDRLAAIALLKQHRPYLERLPSLRRPYESVIPIPLPIIRLRNSTSTSKERQAIKVTETTLLPCDIAFLMCDPEWKIKTGVEIFLFIY
ncbi:hypothetical protein IQ272_17570, partial [Chroococcidiopsidales cyanobacterium LEGE 13417]|nr:hypothetical protein [Chroococcidiopsidales cyanobacterium LEGE 13417]